MLLAFKPFTACITFLCFSLVIFLLTPNKNCSSSHNDRPHHHTHFHLLQQQQQQQQKSMYLLPTCHGRRIYIYKLPAQFSSDLLRRCGYSITSWLNFCPHITHHGFGEALHKEELTFLHHVSTPTFNDSSIKSLESRTPNVIRKMLLRYANIENRHVPSDTGSQAFKWHRTDAYMLEVIFHHRLLQYPCLTDDPRMADAFFLPYYAGLDALNYLYGMEKHKLKTRHGWKLVSWLRHDAIAKEMWARYGGQDHFLVMGRTPWDFGNLGSTEWGTGILHIPEYDNMTLLLIEKQPWMPNQHAIPYPTSFHPHTSSSLHTWMDKVRSERRLTLFAFAGSIRPALMKGGIRNMLLNQCSSSKNCKLLDCKALKCSHNPEPIMSTFLHTQFCLQPRGDTPTRRSLFDSLIAGCVPVLFHNDTAYTQYGWHLAREANTWSVYIDEEEIRKGAKVEDILLTYTQAHIGQMREAVIAMMPKLIYVGYSKERGNLQMQQAEEEPDAFDVSVREVLKVIAQKKQHVHI